MQISKATIFFDGPECAVQAANVEIAAGVIAFTDMDEKARMIMPLERIYYILDESGRNV